VDLVDNQRLPGASEIARNLAGIEGLHSDIPAMPVDDQ
jgi:hypothetical protein